MQTLPLALQKYIATREKRLSDEPGPDVLMPVFKKLLSHGRIEVGGISTCGKYVDPSWRQFTAWNEIVTKAQKLGFKITVTRVQHKNKSPTTCGGWWESNIYEIEKTPQIHPQNAD